MQKKLTLGTLLIVYLVSVAAALKNPLGIPDHHVSISLQAATFVTLGIMLPILRQKSIGAFLVIVAVSLLLRMLYSFVLAKSIEDQRKSWVVRWDAFAKFGGLLVTTALAAHEIGGTPFAILLLGIGLPLLTALPQTSGKTEEYSDLLHTSLLISAAAYKVKRDDMTQDAEYIQAPETGTLAGVTTYGDSANVYVFFAGSESWTDWIRTNADVTMTPLPTAWGLKGSPKVHRGFLNAYMSVRAKIWNLLQDFSLRTGGARSIVVCGHSLGGALATLAALDIAARLDPEDAANIRCVTFGAPQVGDGLFVEQFDAMVPVSLRVAAVYDPVPKFFSSQLGNVKGYIPLASPPILPYTHDLPAYRWGLMQKPVTNVLVMAAPLLSVLISAFMFSYIAPRLT